MDRNWPYVATGYLLTAGVLGSYTTWLLRKLRRADRLGAAAGGAPQAAIAADAGASAGERVS